MNGNFVHWSAQCDQYWRKWDLHKIVCNPFIGQSIRLQQRDKFLKNFCMLWEGFMSAVWFGICCQEPVKPRLVIPPQLFTTSHTTRARELHFLDLMKSPSLDMMGHCRFLLLPNLKEIPTPSQNLRGVFWPSFQVILLSKMQLLLVHPLMTEGRLSPSQTGARSSKSVKSVIISPALSEC